MRLPFLRSKSAEAEPPRERQRAAAKAEPQRLGADEAVAAARTRARRRLVGAVLLLAIGIVGFPILFDSQPRPLPLDTPIELPRREGAVAPAAPPPRARQAPLPVLPVDAGAELAQENPAPAPPVAAASKPAAGAAVVPPPAASPAPSAAPLPAPPVRVAAPAPPPPVARPAAPPAAASASTGRFVVQVGAYTDAATLREARAKVEKLGLKTYTQVIEGDAGKPRTRVRLGPFATREDADAAAAKVKRAGLPANILAL